MSELEERRAPGSERGTPRVSERDQGVPRDRQPGLHPGRPQNHGGAYAVAAARRHGAETMFTLSGGHVFPLYDGAVHAEPPMRIVDVRHEQTAVFAAEATGRLSRAPGFAVLTAGPGVTNGVSAITTAHFNGSPLVVIGGRAPDHRWGSGSLQEIDHPVLLRAITKRAWTEHETGRVGPAVDEAFRMAAARHRGPVFLDVSLEALFGTAEPGQTGHVREASQPGQAADGDVTGRGELQPDPDAVAEIARLLTQARRPVLVLGSDVWLDGADEAARLTAEELVLPVIANGQGRGILPAGHQLLVSRARSLALGEADLVIVAGTALDFRLGYGEFGGKNGAPPAQVVHVADAPDQLAGHRELAGAAAGDLTSFFTQLVDAARSGRAGSGAAGSRRAGSGAAGSRRAGSGAGRSGTEGAAPAESGRASGRDDGWLPRLQAACQQSMAADAPLLASEADPIHPLRIYGELIRLLDADAVVIGDGGDFVSYAGKYIEPRRPGGWLDPGPYGCLGTGLGYAIAARIARPSAQVVLMLGDGAAGFSLMDADTLVRHGLPVVMICGNNGIWGLEKHPMQALYGYDVAADLQPQCRYDQVVSVLGGAGELVTRPADIAPALRRAFDSGVPYMVNVATDPKNVYPRSTTGV